MSPYLLPRRVAILFAAGLVFAALLHYTGIFPAGRLASIPFLVCPFRALTGIPCPGCGMTHALLAIAGGDLQGAFHFNPFSFFLLFLTGLSLMPERQATRLIPYGARGLHVLYVMVLVMVVGYWVCFRVIDANVLSLAAR